MSAGSQMNGWPDPRLAIARGCVMAAMKFLFHVVHRSPLSASLLAGIFSILLVLPDPGHDQIDDGCHEGI